MSVVSPAMALVKVQLQFRPATEPLHATQSFVLYPAAKAYFSYPCPYGDCDGIYDLTTEAAQTLTTEKRSVTGTLVCGGKRAHHDQLRQDCGLRMSYTITATRER